MINKILLRELSSRLRRYEISMNGNRKLKILILNHEYPPVGGGGGKITQNLCEGLANKGYDVRVLTSHYKDLPVQESNQFVVYRLRVHRKQVFRATFKDMLWFVIKSTLKGLKIIHQWEPDVIHAHFAVPAGAAAYFLSRLTGIPYVLTIHGGDVPGAAPEKTAHWFRMVYPFSKLIWNSAERVIAVSEYVKDLAEKNYIVPIQVIGNGINLEQFTPQKIESHAIPRILFVGRLSPEKNPLAVVHSLSTLTAIPWECVVLGDGIMMPEMKTLIRSKIMSDRILLKGWVTQLEVLEWMATSDILFMPSLMEGLPISGLQGLACGLSLILSKTGGCFHLVKEGKNGYLVEPGDIVGYTKALQQLLSDPEMLLQYRKYSVKMSAQFSINAVVDQYDKVFQSLLVGDHS